MKFQSVTMFRMKSLLASVLLFIMAQAQSFGQWYYEKYYVHDINLLSKEQLDESLTNTRDNLLVSLLVGAAGGAFILGGNYTLRHGLSEDAKLIAQLLGDEVMGKAYIVLGIAGAAGGAVASIFYLGRHEKIKSVLRNNFGPTGTLQIAPAFILTDNQKPVIGATLEIRF